MTATRWLMPVLLAAELVLGSLETTNAAGRRGRRPARSYLPAAPATRDAAVTHVPLPIYVRPAGPGGSRSAAAYYQQLYPKYHGGFHAREIQNLGIPSGDIGLRGNGMFWTPW